MGELEVHLQPKEHTFVFVEAKRRTHRQGRLALSMGMPQVNASGINHLRRLKQIFVLLHGTLCVSRHPLSENSPEWKF